MLWTLLIGLIVGALAKLVMPGKDPGGIIITILLGIAGAFLAGFIGRTVGWYRPEEGAGLVASVLGAMLLLFLYRRFRTTT
ncbi:MAG: GlsB/YeaQ/YmgE family stress response membrane protein [Gemmatimonadetes bacterium]|nr:GlsB/YeaQ/YmgE family stress response membrane protein [Gemmatimonadota bacterium]